MLKNTDLSLLKMLLVTLHFKLNSNLGNTAAIDQLKQIVKVGNMPNLILVVSKLKFEVDVNLGSTWYW